MVEITRSDLNFYPPSPMHQSVEYEECLFDYIEIIFADKWTKMPAHLQTSLLYMAQSVISRCFEYADDGDPENSPLEFAFPGNDDMDIEIEDFLDSLI